MMKELAEWRAAAWGLTGHWLAIVCASHIYIYEHPLSLLFSFFFPFSFSTLVNHFYLNS